jgi:hypothetical protein
MQIRAFFGFLSLVANKHIKASPKFLAYAQAIMKHDGITSALPLDANFTVTEFVTAMIYVNSQGRPNKEDRWSLDNMPTDTAKTLAQHLHKDFKKTKTPLSWMD